MHFIAKVVSISVALGALLPTLSNTQAADHETFSCPLSVRLSPIFESMPSEGLDEALRELGYQRSLTSGVVIDATEPNIALDPEVAAFKVAAKLIVGSEGPLVTREHIRFLVQGVSPQESTLLSSNKAAMSAVKSLPRCSEVIDQINAKLLRDSRRVSENNVKTLQLNAEFHENVAGGSTSASAAR